MGLTETQLPFQLYASPVADRLDSGLRVVRLDTGTGYAGGRIGSVAANNAEER
jgi:hypothetical protein